MAESSDAQPAVDLAAQIAVLTAQAQENSNRLMALEEENTTLSRENRALQERHVATEATPQQPHNPQFRVPIMPMQLLFTPDQGGSSSQPQTHQAAVASTAVGHDSARVDPSGTPTVQQTTAQPIQLPPPPPGLPETIVSVAGP